MKKPFQPLKFTDFLLKRPIQCLKMIGSLYMSKFYVNSETRLTYDMIRKKKLILDFFKKVLTT
jgi:hypothetical protein